MAQDTRPPSSRTNILTERVTRPPLSRPIPPQPPADPESTASAWWTHSLPGAVPDAVVPGGYGDHVGYGEPGRRGGVQPDTRPRSGRRSRRQAPATRGHRRAWTIMAVMGGAPLLAAFAVDAMLPDLPPPSHASPSTIPTRATEAAASRSSRGLAGVTPSTASTSPSGVPTDLTAVAMEAAMADLRRAGITVEGTISSAWGWTDERGRSLVATIKEVTSQADDGSPTEVGLRVYYVTGLNGDKPDVQRKLRDPALRCANRGVVTADYTGSAFGVRDLDGNGSPEVMIGWTARCGEPTAVSRVRLAVISGTKLYVLRGTGVVVGQAAQAGTSTDPGATAPGATDAISAPPPAPDSNAPNPTTVPSASQWPATLLDAALATFHGAYY